MVVDLKKLMFGSWDDQSGDCVFGLVWLSMEESRRGRVGRQPHFIPSLLVCSAIPFARSSWLGPSERA